MRRPPRSHNSTLAVTSWSVRRAAIASKTCVAPPVGGGSAGTPSSSTNRTAKLRAPKTLTRLPSVFGSSPWVQRSSCVLSGIGRPAPGLGSDGPP